MKMRVSRTSGEKENSPHVARGLSESAYSISLARKTLIKKHARFKTGQQPASCMPVCLYVCLQFFHIEKQL